MQVKNCHSASIPHIRSFILLSHEQLKKKEGDDVYESGPEAMGVPSEYPHSHTQVENTLT